MYKNRNHVNKNINSASRVDRDLPLSGMKQGRLLADGLILGQRLFISVSYL